MLCTPCRNDPARTSGGRAAWAPLEVSHEWSCLGNLLCDACGAVLPPREPDEGTHGFKASRLVRFGLAGWRTLLEP